MTLQISTFLNSKRKSTLCAFLIIASIILVIIGIKVYIMPIEKPAKKAIRIKINAVKKHTKIDVSSSIRKTQHKNHTTSRKKKNTKTAVTTTQQPKSRTVTLAQTQIRTTEKAVLHKFTANTLKQQTKNVVPQSADATTSQNILKTTKTSAHSKAQHSYYTLQIMNCRKKESVNAFLASNHHLKDVKVQKVGKIKPRFRIYTGKFQTYTEAQEAKKKLKHPLYHDCFIRKIEY